MSDKGTTYSMELFRSDLPAGLTTAAVGIPKGMAAAAEENLREGGISLWMGSLNPEALRVPRRAPLGEARGDERLLPHLREAVAAYEALPAEPQERAP